MCVLYHNIITRGMRHAIAMKLRECVTITSMRRKYAMISQTYQYFFSVNINVKYLILTKFEENLNSLSR